VVGRRRVVCERAVTHQRTSLRLTFRRERFDRLARKVLRGQDKNQMQNQKDFLKAEFWMSSWSASVQRSGLYKDRAGSDPARKKFQLEVRSLVDEELLPKYINGCSEEDRYSNIGKLEKWGSHHGADLLSNGYPFGIAQKLLNVYLKYQWCSGWISEPLHCPIDRTILKKLRLESRFIWTTMKESDYRAAIDVLKRVALQDGLSPAQWELHEFRRAAAPE
jgi:hypothetical protein